MIQRPTGVCRFTKVTLALVGVFGCGFAPPVERYDLAIAGVTLIDGNGGPPRQDVSVYVRDGRIAAVADARQQRTAETVVDGAGKYLVPGLIDAHAHPFPVEESFPEFVRHGVTSILIPGCSVCSPENLARARALSTSGELAAPRVFHTSQHFTMEGRHPVKTYPSPDWVEGRTVYFLREQGDAAGAVEAVADQPIVGIKLTIEDGPVPPLVEMIPVERVREVVEAAHERGLEVFAHVSSVKGLRVAEAGGVDHLLHFVGLDIDWARDAAMIDRLRQRDPSWVTTLMVDKALLYPLHPQWLEALEASGVADADEILRLQASRSAGRSLEVLEQLYPGRRPTLEGILGPQVEDLRGLHDRGFSLVVGTDTANRFIFPGRSVHEEMEILALGFEPSEILPIATRNAAAMLGALDELGTLEVGKRADMVLLEADPLEDIRNVRRIGGVWRDGQLLFAAESSRP